MKQLVLLLGFVAVLLIVGGVAVSKSSVKFGFIPASPGPGKGTISVQTFPIGSQTANASATPMPSITASPTPSPHDIDVSSSGTDWDDVDGVIEYGPPNQLSRECQTEMIQAAGIEERNTSGTRVQFCEVNASCQQNGYDHYTGSAPLPSAIPSVACQTEIKKAYAASVNDFQTKSSMTPVQKQMVLNDVKPPIAPNCDLTDGICGNPQNF